MPGAQVIRFLIQTACPQVGMTGPVIRVRAGRKPYLIPPPATRNDTLIQRETGNR
jgi:hypothetical protein